MITAYKLLTNFMDNKVFSEEEKRKILYDLNDCLDCDATGFVRRISDDCGFSISNHPENITSILGDNFLSVHLNKKFDIYHINEPIIIKNLNLSIFNQIDPIIQKFKVHSVIGHPVFTNDGVLRGSVYGLYSQKSIKPGSLSIIESFGKLLSVKMSLSK